MSNNIAEIVISEPDYDTDKPPMEFGDHLREIERFSVAGGCVTVVEQPCGDIGFSANGKRADEILNTLVLGYSPLETYEILGGKRAKAPSRLVVEHEQLYLGNLAAERRQLPDLDELPIAQGPLYGGGASSDLGMLGGAACIENDVDPFEYFQVWFNSYTGMWTGVGPLGSLGANGASGTGIWRSVDPNLAGDADITLLPTTAGALCVCFHDSNNAIVTVQIGIFHSPGSWVDIFSTNPGAGSGYGFWFKGTSVIQRVRLIVRNNNESDGGHPFAWGASY